MDCSLPGSSVHGIFQARVLEWSAIAFSEGQDIPASISQSQGISQSIANTFVSIHITGETRRRASQVALVVNASAGDIKDLGLIPLLGRSPEGGHDPGAPPSPLLSGQHPAAGGSPSAWGAPLWCVCIFATQHLGPMGTKAGNPQVLIFTFTEKMQWSSVKA